MISKLLGFTPTLYIDAGHGMDTAGKRTPAIPGVGVIKEFEFNDPTAVKLQTLAEGLGFRVIRTNPEDYDISLSTRSARINTDFNSLKAANSTVPPDKLAVSVSIHFNAYNGKFDNKAGGIETYHYPGDLRGQELAGSVQLNLVKGTPARNRGVKSQNFHMVREPEPPAILVECGFMDKLEEAKLMRDEAYQAECAGEILTGILEYYGLSAEDLPSYKTPILDTTLATVEQAQEWARSKGASQTFIDLAPIFWETANLHQVNPAGAYAQSAKETGYGNFGGVIDETYHNTCGMKTSSGGGNYDPGAHQRFDSWADGILAQIQHLALYAGATGYPLKDPMDPRHFNWIAGVAPNFEDLGGKWAGSKSYGTDIVKMLKQIEATEVKEPESDLQEKLDLMTIRAETAEAKLRQINAISGH